MLDAAEPSSGGELDRPRSRLADAAVLKRADWQKYVQGLVELGRAAYRASQTRSQDAVAKIADQLSDTCANCHRVYRDVASAAMRCTPP